ncbi:uncharacterized protein ACR2FA_005950 [Aphomia sociella]
MNNYQLMPITSIKEEIDDVPYERDPLDPLERLSTKSVSSLDPMDLELYDHEETIWNDKPEIKTYKKEPPSINDTIKAIDTSKTDISLNTKECLNTNKKEAALTTGTTNAPDINKCDISPDVEECRDVNIEETKSISDTKMMIDISKSDISPDMEEYLKKIWSKNKRATRIEKIRDTVKRPKIYDRISIEHRYASITVDTGNRTTQSVSKDNTLKDYFENFNDVNFLRPTVSRVYSRKPTKNSNQSGTTNVSPNINIEKTSEVPTVNFKSIRRKEPSTENCRSTVVELSKIKAL